MPNEKQATNLTDEGLREMAQEIAEFHLNGDCACEHERMCHVCRLQESIFEVIREVRDAAKKEEMERIAVKVDALDPLDTNSHGWEYGEMEQVAGDIHDRYVKAIRQMGGGK